MSLSRGPEAAVILSNPARDQSELRDEHWARQRGG